MNRIRPGIAPWTVDASHPPAREGLVLVEDLVAFDPAGLVGVPRRGRVTRVLKDYPGAGAKLLNYVLKEGLGPTLEKTRTKLDQKRVATDLAMSAVGTVAAAPAGSGLAAGDRVACGGFQLPVSAESYLFHVDQCRKVARDVDGLEMHLWLGAAIELARRLAADGARRIVGLSLGPLAAAFDDWLGRLGLRAESASAAEAAVAGSATWSRGAPAHPPAGYVIDPFAVCGPLPSAWRAVGVPDPGRHRISPFDPRPLDWPFPFGRAARDEAVDRLLETAGGVRSSRRAASGGRLAIPRASVEDRSFGVSIVGCGSFARAVVLYHALRVPGVRLRGICDIRPEVAALHAASLGAAFHTSDFSDVLADDGTQAVLVTTDHGSHAAHVAAALDGGKSAHVEKPPAVTPDQLTLLLDAVGRTRGTLTVGYNRPFAPAYPLLMRAVGEESGPVSTAMIVKGFKLPPEQWYYWPGQGTRLAGNLCHWIDLGYRITRHARPVAVHVLRDRRRAPAEVADIALVGIRFDDGSLVSIAFTSAGSDLHGVRERIEVRRGDLAVEIDDFDELRLRRGAKSVRRSFGRDRGHAAEIRHQVERLRSGRRDAAVLSDTIMTSAILFAAQRSFESGREEDVVVLDAWRPYLV